ncbi:MAG: metal ABC transporter permease [Actinomycetia bacterium]|nr:metal ABC transporter permease [Actinomycetes bacterium]MCH9801879.1 metal ABC transporter permease [Actinomycetes bacterium]
MSPLDYDFMQRALLAAIIVGALAPMIGVFLVQRRLALLGDGMGHVALTGVGLAFLLGTQPIATALIVAIAGAAFVEIIRAKSRAVGDVALALVFYGGIAGGVLLASLASGSSSTALNQYLFGSLATVTAGDVVALVTVAVVVGVLLVLLGRKMFAVSLDPDLAQVQGIRVQWISLLISVLASVVVVIGMRTVGLLLVAAIMVVPVAAAQQVSRSFASTAAVAVAVGLVSAIVGLLQAFYLNVPSGPTIVITALAAYVLAAIGSRVIGART